MQLKNLGHSKISDGKILSDLGKVIRIEPANPAKMRYKEIT